MSWLGRLFGRDDDPPLPLPREDGPVRTPPAPVDDRTRHERAVRERRAADHTVGELEKQEAHLSAQLHGATEAGQTDYVRELLSRRRAVIARLEEAELKRERLRRTEERLSRVVGAPPPPPPAPPRPAPPPVPAAASPYARPPSVDAATPPYGTPTPGAPPR